MAKKPIIVTVKKTKHKTNPYTFSIDDIGGGPQITVKERYTRSSDAKRAALRKLKAYHMLQVDNGKTVKAWYDAKGRAIEFVTNKKK